MSSPTMGFWFHPETAISHKCTQIQKTNRKPLGIFHADPYALPETTQRRVALVACCHSSPQGPCEGVKNILQINDIYISTVSGLCIFISSSFLCVPPFFIPTWNMDRWKANMKQWKKNTSPIRVLGAEVIQFGTFGHREGGPPPTTRTTTSLQWQQQQQQQHQQQKQQVQIQVNHMYTHTKYKYNKHNKYKYKWDMKLAQTQHQARSFTNIRRKRRRRHPNLSVLRQLQDCWSIFIGDRCQLLQQWHISKWHLKNEQGSIDYGFLPTVALRGASVTTAFGRQRLQQLLRFQTFHGPCGSLVATSIWCTRDDKQCIMMYHHIIYIHLYSSIYYN